jgi:uncharacterized protein
MRDNEWMTPSARLWRMRVTEACVAGAVAALVAGFCAGVVAGGGAGTGALAVVIAVAATVAAAGLAVVFLRNRYRSWAYRERAEDLIVARGVLVRRVCVVPYGRMQFVEVTAGPVERMFKLATVKLHTAAAGSDARIPGLERDEAARLRDRLATLGEAKAAGL